MSDTQKHIERAYGLLWHVTIDTGTSQGRLVSDARKALLEVLTHDERGAGIAAAREWISDHPKSGYSAPFYQPALDRDTQIEELAREVERLRERSAWHPMKTCPYHTGVDLWCVYGDEEFAQYDGGAPIGTLIQLCYRNEEYEFFGNKNKNHVPQCDAPDMVPVAWRYEMPNPAPEMIAKTLGIPLTREDAIAQDAALGKEPK